MESNKDRGILRCAAEQYNVLCYALKINATSYPEM
jgi:hypothetical protein